MLSTRRWDAIVAIVSIVVAMALLTAFRPEGAVRLTVGLASIVLLAVGYVAIGRAAVHPPRASWRFPVFLAVAALAVGVGTGAAPFLAILQTLAYPLAWVVGDSRRRGIGGSIVIAASVFAGAWLGNGGDAAAAVSGLATAVFSLAFSIAIGLWIAYIAEYGQERARLLAELQAAQTQVEALSRDRGAAQERERLARDIHDTLAQTLAGLVIFAERAGRQSRGGQTDAAAATISTVEQVARDALGEARALVARTAAVPSEPVFESAVQRLVERFRAHGPAQISLDAGAVAGRLDRETQVVVLRCLQEALSNAAKHAGAVRVSVRVEADTGGPVTLTVADDGRGFDPAAPAAGFGLDGMRERVALAGGALEVSSRPGRGTTVRVVLPGAAAPVAHDAAGGAA
ncbi:sensor histidine kinase [Microbacterium sp. BWT-B31]|uniref:sensor histidine kinase n=1 Tax=Microbacterium sp. BWT-B31 TaxID=3232072 RepID=UPI0035298A24